jgi:hypothetical protein
MTDLAHNWHQFAEDHIEVFLGALADRWDAEIERGRATIEDAQPRWHVEQPDAQGHSTMREAPRGTFKGEHAWRGTDAVWYGHDIFPDGGIDDVAIARVHPSERRHGKYAIAYRASDRHGREAAFDLTDMGFNSLDSARKFVADTYEMRMRDAHAQAWLQAQYRGHGRYLLDAAGMVGQGIAGGLWRGMAQREINTKLVRALQHAIAEHMGEGAVSIESQRTGGDIFTTHGAEFLRHLYENAGNGRRTFDDVEPLTTAWLASKQLLPVPADVQALQAERERAYRAAVEQQHRDQERREVAARADGTWLRDAHARKRARMRTKAQEEQLREALAREGLPLSAAWQVHDAARILQADGRTWADAYRLSAMKHAERTKARQRPTMDVGDTVILSGAQGLPDEEVMLRGFIGDDATVLMRGMQMTVPRSRIRPKE